MSPPPVHGPYRPLLHKEYEENLGNQQLQDERSLSAQNDDTAVVFRGPDLPISSIEVHHNYDDESPSRHGTNANGNQSERRSDSATRRASSPSRSSNSDDSDGIHISFSGRRPRTNSSGSKNSIFEGNANENSNGDDNGNNGQRPRPRRVCSNSLVNTDLLGLSGVGGPARRAFFNPLVNTDLLGPYKINGSTTEQDTEEDTEEEREERHEKAPPGPLRGGPGGGGLPGPPGDPPEGDDDLNRFSAISPEPLTPVEYPESPTLPDFGGQSPEMSPDPPTPREDSEVPAPRDPTMSPDPLTPVEYPESPVLPDSGGQSPETSSDPPTLRENSDFTVPRDTTMSPDPPTPLEPPESQPATVASTSRWSPAPSVPPLPPFRPAVSGPRLRIVNCNPGKPTVPDAPSSNSGPRPIKHRRKICRTDDDQDYVNGEEEEDDDDSDDKNCGDDGDDTWKGPPRDLGGRKRTSPSHPCPPPTSPKRVLRDRTINLSDTETSALKAGRKRAADPSSNARTDTKKRRAKAASSLVKNDIPTTKCSVYVLGENRNGQLGMGNGAPVQYKQPVKNTQLPDVMQVAAGGEHCIVLTHDNKIYTWGDNSYGQLGRLTNTTTDPMPREVDLSTVNLSSYTIFTQVVATRSACFVLTMFGDVYGWGTFSEIYENENDAKNSETLGFRRRGKCQRTPYHIQELKNVKQLAAGSDHVLAQIAIPIGGNKANSAGIAPKREGTQVRNVVRSWGAHKRGQLGRTAANDANCLTPLLCDFSGNSSRAMKYPDNVATIGSGKFHSFVIKESGNILAWGYNKFAKTGIVPPAASPVLRHDSKVDRPGTVTSLAGQRTNCLTGGVNFSVAVTDDGRCLSWGSIQDGVLGIPDMAMPCEADIIKVANGDGTQIPAIVKVPTSVPGLNIDGTKIKMVSAGWTHTVAVTKCGKALGWGSNDHYEIHPDKTKHPIKDAVEIPMKDLRVVEAAAGCFFTILLVQSE
ncbi:regulator of chromosome condensation 1/beta-lactamase-inhibitor protein II [Aspergillus desertorum]